MTEQRRLAAILVADVVGYSKLIGSDESGTLGQLQALRSEIIDPQLAKHAGRLFKSVGDGFLIEFASAVQAVTCARAIQKANAAGELPLRIGIHVGDVVVHGDDLMGDGVNIAARIEGIAEAGGIAISRAVHEQVRDRLDLAFDDRGEIALKNIARPVQVFVVSGGTASGTPVALTLPDKPSIAVLPFQNMSGDPEQDYFVDGVVEDITTGLSKFRELFVIARNSAFSYKGRAVDVRQVARELGVRYVLEGSSRKAGNRVRVTAQLIDCESGSHIWAERYDRDLVDIFAVQEEITRAIVSTIAPTIGASVTARARQLQPASLKAYELAMRAWFEANAAYASNDSTLRDQSAALARRALELDPACVIALATQAWLCWQSVFYSQKTSTPEMCRPGLDAARRAIELDRFDHRSYAFRGLLSLELGQFDDALADLRHAYALNPNDARTIQGLAFAELMNGDTRLAKQHGLEALRLNPQDPMRYNDTSFMANVCFVTEEYSEGLKWVAESRRSQPNFRPTITSAIKLYVGLGQLDLARAEAGRIRTPVFEERIRKGISRFRRPEHRERELSFYRIALGFPEPASEPSPALALPDKPSIAVLPFQNMSGDPEQEYFADGIVEDIITALSRFKSLFVIARNSSFTYKGRAVNIKQVGRELGVRYVLEGSVRKAGGRVRITGQLIEAETGIHLWADRFDGALEDVFDLQDQITTSVVGAIVPKVDQAELDRAKGKRTGSLGAYDHVLRGLAGLHALHREGAAAALEHFREAIRLDPTYSPAYAWAVIAHARRRQSRWMVDIEQESEEAARFGRMAIDLAKDDAGALASGGFAIGFFGSDLEAGLGFVDRALDLNPNLAVAWQASGWLRTYNGDAETAIEHLSRSLRLNPIDPHTVQLYMAMAVALRCAGRYRESAEWAKKALREAPEFVPAMISLAAAQALSGRLAEARQAAQRALEIDPDLRLANFGNSVFFRRPQDRDALNNGLQLAGIPE